MTPVHVDSKDNLADLFTKILDKHTFVKLRDTIMYPHPAIQQETRTQESDRGIKFEGAIRNTRYIYLGHPSYPSTGGAYRRRRTERSGISAESGMRHQGASTADEAPLAV